MHAGPWLLGLNDSAYKWPTGSRSAVLQPPATRARGEVTTVTTLTTEQMKALDDMVRRRMENTGESETEARIFLAQYLRERADDEWYRRNPNAAPERRP
jgi:hypothetical protein